MSGVAVVICMCNNAVIHAAITQIAVMCLWLGTMQPVTAGHVNKLRPRQNGCQFADDVYIVIFVNWNWCVLIKISLKYVLKGPIDNNPALIWIMAWRWTGYKPLSEPMTAYFGCAYMLLVLSELRHRCNMQHKICIWPYLRSTAFNWLASGRFKWQF